MKTMKTKQKGKLTVIEMITTTLATKHDIMAYENKTESKANGHKDHNRNASHVAWLMKTK